MGRASTATDSTTPPPNGTRDPARDPRDPRTPSHGRDLLAAIAVIAVLFAILVVYTHDVPVAPRSTTFAPVPWAKTAPAKPPVDWSAVPLTSHPSELGPALERSIGAKILKERARITACLAGTEGAGAVGAGAQVVLRLAPRSSTLNVEGVEPGGPETASAALDCARQALDGDPIPAPGVVPGRRYRVRVALR